MVSRHASPLLKSTPATHEKTQMPLIDAKIKSLKPKPRRYLVSDGKGLSLGPTRALRPEDHSKRILSQLDRVLELRDSSGPTPTVAVMAANFYVTYSSCLEPVDYFCLAVIVGCRGHQLVKDIPKVLGKGIVRYRAEIIRIRKKRL